MPEIKFQHVASVSSEDKHFPAENLLKHDGFKKWKCLAGEKNAIVTIQFEKASEISQIDIGNEGSAFVEVLVGKSASGDDSYQVILMASSFMNPAESRSSKNLNCVRIFGSDTLSKAVAGQKWDRARIVCTQPFAKGTQYGLSFIKFYSPPVDDKTEIAKGSPSKQLTLGSFVLRTGLQSDSIKTGSLFEKSKQKLEEPAVTGMAVTRTGSQVDIQKNEVKPSDCTNTVTMLPVNVKRTSSDEKKSTTKEDDGRLKVKRGAEENTSQRSYSPPPKKSKPEPIASSSSSSSSDVPFGQLMKNVAFVLSGFQNPFRGQLRDKAQEMGATYRSDWGPGCTHLICAFENTPKYNEVKGKGYIVKKEWVIDCYKQKKLLPWRQYRLGRAPSPKSSDSEGDREPEKQKVNFLAVPPGDKSSLEMSQTKKKQEMKGTKVKTEINKNGEKKTFHQISNEDTQKANDDDTDSMSDSNLNDNYNQKSKDKMKVEKNDSPVPSTSAVRNDSPIPSTSAVRNNSPIPSTSAQKTDEDLYNASTDEEFCLNEEDKLNDQLPELPDFFSGKAFFLYGNFSPEDRRLLTRYIVAYDGSILDYMADFVNYVVTDEAWDDNFDQALADNADLIFVKSSWLHACYEAQQLMPYQKYAVTPQ